MSVDQALEDLAAAMNDAGIPLWEPPQSSQDLAELDAALAPMRVPDQLRQFWQQVDAATLRISPYPGFIGPSMALEFWRSSKAEFAAFQPLALVDVGYESHFCMGVELDFPDQPGGALFEWCVSDPSGFTRRFNTLADWLTYIAQLLREGLYQRINVQSGHLWLVPSYENTDAEQALRPIPAAHPVHGAEPHIGGDILDWPEHWQRANGLHEEDVPLRGATHTIADVLATPTAEELRATIIGKVTSLMGASWTFVRVHDGTGALDVMCPADTTLLGPAIDSWYEFDIVVPAGPRHVPADPDTAADGLTDPVEQVTAVLMARHGGPAGATAEAVRRMAAPR